MDKSRPIQVFEHDTLKVGSEYSAADTSETREFKLHHFDLLAQYITKNTGCPFFALYHQRVKFNQYVGVIRVGNLTIEVLPKTDRHEANKSVWQKVLLEMLLISHQVKAETTTWADISMRKHSVLDSYILQFIKEAEYLVHRGLIKKYRTNVGNQKSLKGKLLIHQQITRNAFHAERFYVAHSVYDRDNIFNFIIRATLECIESISLTNDLKKLAQSLLLFFPECQTHTINDGTFSQLQYDRKTAPYKRAIELARIILLNYHPDIKGGKNNILAIMFDMNELWENFIYWSIKKAISEAHLHTKVKAQQKTLFWKPGEGNNLRLIPDIVLTQNGENIVLDTKWKYQSKPSVEDVRQLYAYGHYFHSKCSYLLYPDRVEDESKVIKKKGDYYEPVNQDIDDSKMSCGLLFADLLVEGKLNREIGKSIISLLV